jgi:hypothetical protein
VIANSSRINDILISLKGLRNDNDDVIKGIEINNSSVDYEDITNAIIKEIYENSSVIIADYDIFKNVNSIDDLKSNLKIIDNCIDRIKNLTLENDLNFIITSLYGLSRTFKINDKEVVNVDFSDGLPFCLVSKGIIAKKYLLNKISYEYLQNSVINNNSLDLVSNKGKGNKNSLLIVIVIVIIVALVISLYFLGLI